MYTMGPSWGNYLVGVTNLPYHTCIGWDWIYTSRVRHDDMEGNFKTSALDHIHQPRDGITLATYN